MERGEEAGRPNCSLAWSPLSDRDFIMDWFVFLLREGEEVGSPKCSLVFSIP
jgi:hypothetical protein